jgi:hypothetical protein
MSGQSMPILNEVVAMITRKFPFGLQADAKTFSFIPTLHARCTYQHGENQLIPDILLER